MCLVRREEAMRREFVDDLLAGTADPAGLLVRAPSYGVQLAGPHAVVLAWSGPRSRRPVVEGHELEGGLPNESGGHRPRARLP
ncbi:MAG TPA: hypothetical protein VE155_05245 [Pseudonocardiaceae bacterium]|nr:hypothetical protein [Pseudonocardiaceae bacterium]